LQAVSGNPLLTPAALTAVQQWRFKPYLLNGEPTDVEALITVTFSLNQG
jgi:protein TonB